MDQIRIRAVGDIMLHTIGEIDPFALIPNLKSNSDILFGNLETVLTREGRELDKYAPLSSEPEYIDFLLKHNFNLVNIANNHILDFGKIGFINTVNILKKKNLAFIGGSDRTPDTCEMIFKYQGKRIGFLGYTRGVFYTPSGITIRKINKKHILKDIKFLKTECDYVIISLHWGIENVYYPSPDQIVLARELIDNGAHLILGHHPHSIQGIERYKNGLIAYSLGNFQFDPILSKTRTNNSIMLDILLSNGSVIEYSIIPIHINDTFQPEISTSEQKLQILNFVEKISQKIINDQVSSKWWYEQISSTYLRDNMQSYKYRIFKKKSIYSIFEFIVWHFTPLYIRCYLSYIRKTSQTK